MKRVRATSANTDIVTLAMMAQDVAQAFEIDADVIDILARQRNQITSIRVTPLKAEQPEESRPQ